MLCEENIDIINVKLRILILSCTYASLLNCCRNCRFYKYSFVSISKAMKLSKNWEYKPTSQHISTGSPAL